MVFISGGFFTINRQALSDERARQGIFFFFSLQSRRSPDVFLRKRVMTILMSSLLFGFFKHTYPQKSAFLTLGTSDVKIFINFAKGGTL